MDLNVIAASVAGAQTQVRVALFSRKTVHDLSKQYLIRLFLEDRARQEGHPLSGDEYDVMVTLAHTDPIKYKAFKDALQEVTHLISPRTGEFESYESVTRNRQDYEKLKAAVDHLRHEEIFRGYSPMGQRGHGITANDYRKLVKLIELVRKYERSFQDISSIPDLDKVTPSAIRSILKSRYDNPDDQIWALNEIYRSLKKDPRAIMPAFSGSKNRQTIIEKTKDYVKKDDPWSIFSSLGGPGKDYRALKEAALMPWLQSAIMDVLEQVALDIRPEREYKSQSISSVDKLSPQDTASLLKAYVPILPHEPYLATLKSVAADPSAAAAEGKATLDLTGLINEDLDRVTSSEYVGPSVAGPGSPFIKAFPKSLLIGKGEGIEPSFIKIVLKTLQDFLRDPARVIQEAGLDKKYKEKRDPHPLRYETDEEASLTPGKKLKDNELAFNLGSSNLDKLSEVIKSNIKNKIFMFKVPDPNDLDQLVQGKIKPEALSTKYKTVSDLKALVDMAKAIREYKSDSTFRYHIVPLNQVHRNVEVSPSHEAEFLRRNPGIAHLHHAIINSMGNMEGPAFTVEPYSYLYKEHRPKLSLEDKARFDNIIKGKKRWTLTDTLSYLDRVGGLQKVPFDFESPIKSGLLPVNLQSIANQIEIEPVTMKDGTVKKVPFMRQDHINSRRNKMIPLNPSDTLCKELAKVLTQVQSGRVDGGRAADKLEDLQESNILKKKEVYDASDAYTFIANGGLTEFTSHLPPPSDMPPGRAEGSFKMIPLMDTVKELLEWYKTFNMKIRNADYVKDLEGYLTIFDSDDLARLLSAYLVSPIAKTDYSKPEKTTPVVKNVAQNEIKRLESALRTAYDLIKEYGGDRAVNSKGGLNNAIYDLQELVGDKPIPRLKSEETPTSPDVQDWMRMALIGIAKSTDNPKVRARVLDRPYIDGIDQELHDLVETYMSTKGKPDEESLEKYLYDNAYHVSVSPTIKDIMEHLLSSKEKFMEAFRHSGETDPYRYLYTLRSIVDKKPSWDKPDLKFEPEDLSPPDIRVDRDNLGAHGQIDGMDRRIPVLTTEIGDLEVEYTFDEEFKHSDEYGVASRINEFRSHYPSVLVLNKNKLPRALLDAVLDQANDSIFGSVFSEKDINRILTSAGRNNYYVDPGSLAIGLHDEVNKLGLKEKILALKSERTGKTEILRSNEYIQGQLAARVVNLKVIKQEDGVYKSEIKPIRIWEYCTDALHTIMYKIKSYDFKSSMVDTVNDLVNKIPDERVMTAVSEFIKLKDPDEPSSPRFPELSRLSKYKDKPGAVRSMFKKWLATENDLDGGVTREKLIPYAERASV